MPKTIILIVAAGRGLRAGGDLPKQYARLAGRDVLARTIDAFMEHSHVTNVAAVIHPDDRELYDAASHGFDDRLLPPISGGKSRQESVHNGLKALLPHNPDYVLVHDAARPFVDQPLINRVIAGLADHEAVLPVLPVTDTIKLVENGHVRKTIDRKTLFGAQTPQGFAFPLLLELHERAGEETEVSFTDDASIAEWADIEVKTVKGSLANQKLTTRRDMEMAELVLAGNEPPMETRTGLGFDVHRFEPGNGVILCGVKIPFNKKLKGHSDADVALHALTDSILGAIGEGDIGTHFPPSHAEWKDADSAVFLEHAVDLVKRRGGKIINVDVTIICEAPKIVPHRNQMRVELARIMDLEAHRISIKATTTEQLGFTGRSEGIAAQAVASLSLPEKHDV